MTTNAETIKKVTINMKAADLAKLIGTRIPTIAEGDHYAGTVWGANKPAQKAYDALTTQIAALVPEGARKTVLELNQLDAAVLFYAVTIGGGSTYESGTVLNEKTYTVIAGLVKAGFPFPARELVY